MGAVMEGDGRSGECQAPHEYWLRGGVVLLPSASLSASLATRARARLVLQVGHTATLYRTPLDPSAAV